MKLPRLTGRHSAPTGLAALAALAAHDLLQRDHARDQRRWVYASSKNENNYFGFGTDNDIEYTAGYPVIKHRTFGRAVPPSSPAAGHEVGLPSAKVLGAARGRAGCLPPGVGGQHLRDELRVAVRCSRGGAQPRRGAGRLPAQHR